MKKLITLFVSILLISYTLNAAYTDELQLKIEKLKDGYADLKELVPKLGQMYKDIEFHNKRAADGIKRSEEGLIEMKQSKKEINSTKMPYALKKKIVSALSNLEDVLPAISHILSTLKKNMDGDLKDKDDNLASLTTKFSEINGYMEGPSSISVRLGRIIGVIKKGEQAKSTIEHIKERILEILRKFYKG